MPQRDVDHLLIGGGIAAGNCARQLRRGGADGTIMLVGREPDLPYDRPPLSKEYLQGTQERDAALVEDAGWYGRSDDLQSAARLIAASTDLGDRAGELGDLSSDLEQLGA
jgi:3-phenylpropionate/trans-cinnamate dioxygenase ferredoxin reductase subunit